MKRYKGNSESNNTLEMLQAYQSMKERAQVYGDTTRKIYTQGLVSLNESSIAALPTLSSVKRTIRRHKSSVDNGVNHDSAAELQLPEIYRFTMAYLIYG